MNDLAMLALLPWQQNGWVRLYALSDVYDIVIKSHSLHITDYI